MKVQPIYDLGTGLDRAPEAGAPDTRAVFACGGVGRRVQCLAPAVKPGKGVEKIDRTPEGWHS